MKSFLKNKINILLILSLIAGIGLAGLLANVYINDNRKIVMPNFTNSALENVDKWCKNLPDKYSCTINYELSDSIERGYVISQAPVAGNQIKDNIYFTVSYGRKTYIEPIQINELTSLEDVNTWAKKYGILDNLNIVYEENKTVSQGLVTKIMPTDNITEDTKITVYVSKGNPTPESIEVKSGEFLNISENSFIDKTSKLDLVANHVSGHDAYSDDVAAGNIVWHGSGIYEAKEKINYGVSLGVNPNGIVVNSGEYVGKTEADFKDIVSKLKLNPNHKESKDEHSDSIPKGNIIWHGSGDYEENETINYGLSLGKNNDRYISKNQFAGYTVDEFTNAVSKYKLTPKYTNEYDAYSDDIEEGKIIWHGYGEFEEGENEIRYSKSLGKAPKVVVEDGHLGDSEEKFLAYLNSLGLSGKKLDSNASDTYASGTVMYYQTGEFNKGSAINYRLSSGVENKLWLDTADNYNNLYVDDFKGYSETVDKLKNGPLAKFTNVTYKAVSSAKTKGQIASISVGESGDTSYDPGNYSSDTAIVVSISN